MNTEYSNELYKKYAELCLDKKQYSVIALPFGNDFNENEEYTFEIIPIHLWMIEK